MTASVDVRERWIRHFTHLDNLPGMRHRGELLCDAKAHGLGLRTEVGAQDIKAARRHRRVPAGPGGVVGDYVPFYFAHGRRCCTASPATAGTRCPTGTKVGDRPLVYLASTVGTVVDAGLGWVGSDGNAASAVTAFVDDLDRLNAVVDWPLMFERLWQNTPDDRDRQRRRMAEFLVHESVPLGVVHRIATYSEDQAQFVRRTMRGHPLAERVLVRPDWYFGYERR